jgi:hypothetical protein
LLERIADPSEQVAPRFFSAYQYQFSELVDTVELPAITPGIGGNLVPIIRDDISGLALSDVETFTGSRIRSQGIAGGGLAFSVPSGQSLIVEGDFDAGPFVDWLDSLDIDSLGTQDGYDQYAATPSEGKFEAFAVTDDRFIAVSRSDVSFGPEQALSLELNYQSGEGNPVEESVPAVADVVSALDDRPIRRATGYALVPLGSDSGTQAFDDVVRGVLASGLSASVDTETQIQRAVGYVDSGMASESALTTAFEASDSDELDAEWSTGTDGTVVSARATVEATPSPAMLKTALPIPGYRNLWNPVDPTKLGRDSPPIVYFQPSVDDSGTLTVEQIGGPAVEDLLVRYIHDGSEQRESWTGPVEKGDQFESEESVDSGTQVWVVWQSDTVDAAILSRFQTPS